MTGFLKKIPINSIAAIMNRMDLSETAQKILSPEDTPQTALIKLDNENTEIDLISFFAHALPLREGICWGLNCLSQLDAVQEQQSNNALTLVKAWVETPSEQNRVLCQAEAVELGTEGPLGWLCLAVDWNGSGSIAPPGDPIVMPAPSLYCKALFGAVALSLDKDEDDRAQLMETYKLYGFALANGEWPLPKLGVMI